MQKQLPNDILEIIITYTTHARLYTFFQNNNISPSSKFPYKSHEFATIEEMNNIFTYFPNIIITHVYLTDITNKTNMMKLNNKIKYVKHVTLRGCFTKLIIPPYCTKIKSIECLECHHLSDITITSIPNYAELEHIKINCIHMVPPPPLSILPQAMSWLNACTKLKTIHIVTNATDLSFLKACTNLRTVALLSCCKLISIDVLGLLHNLKRVIISGCDDLVDISPLGKCERLEHIYLTGNTKIQDVSALSNCTRLTHIRCGDNSKIYDFTFLLNLTRIQNVTVLDGIRKHTFLQKCSGIREFHVRTSDEDDDNMKIKKLASTVKQIMINGCNSIYDSNDVCNFVNLKEITFYACSNLKSLSNLEKLTKLEIININECPALCDIRLNNLKRLNTMYICGTLAVSVDIRGTKYFHKLCFRNCDTVALSDSFESSELKDISFEYCEKLRDISMLRKMTQLSSVTFLKCNNIANYDVVGDLKKLWYIEIDSDTLKKFSFSSDCEMGHITIKGRKLKNISFGTFKLKTLVLYGCFTNLVGLEGLKGLEQVELYQCHNLVDISCLNSMSSLSDLKIKECGKITNTNIGGLAKLSLEHLEHLDVGISNIVDLNMGKTFKNLKTLILCGRKWNEGGTNNTSNAESYDLNRLSAMKKLRTVKIGSMHAKNLKSLVKLPKLEVVQICSGLILYCTAYDDMIHLKNNNINIDDRLS